MNIKTLCVTMAVVPLVASISYSPIPAHAAEMDRPDCTPGQGLPDSRCVLCPPVYAPPPQLLPLPPTELELITGKLRGTDFAVCKVKNPPLGHRSFYFSHGTVTDRPNTPEGKEQEREDIIGELRVDGQPLPALFAALGSGAFAWVERRDQGFSAINLAKGELRDLRARLEDRGNAILPDATSYLLGVSQGSNIVTNLFESDWMDFDGAGAVCGPIGNFWKQLQYQADVLNLVDHYLGDVICDAIDEISGCSCAEVDGRSRLLRPDPNNPPWLKVVDIPETVVACADEVGDQIQSIFEKGDQAQAVANVLAVARLDKNNVFNGDNGASLVGGEVGGIVAEVIRNQSDAVQTLHGPIYSNKFRIYRGSNNDYALNKTIQRFNPYALPARIEVKRNYETSGELFGPLVTPHNLSFLGEPGQDPRVPGWHPLLYKAKAVLNGAGSLHSIVPLKGYGHCNINLEQALLSIGLLVCQVEDLPICSSLPLPPSP